MAADLNPQNATALYADAHARMDEHEKRLTKAESGMSPEIIAGILQGAVGALFAQMKAEIDRAMKAPREDPQAAKLLEGMAQMTACMTELIGLLKEPRKYLIVRDADGKISEIH